MLDVRCWMYNVGCAMADVRCGLWDVRCAMYDLECERWDVGLVGLIIEKEIQL